MKAKWFGRGGVVGVAAAALLAVTSGVAIATTLLTDSYTDADGKYHGCVATAGQLRVVAPGEKCREAEVAIDWNRVGAQGPPGPQGEPGPRGSARAYGWIGATGTAYSWRSLNIASVVHPFTGVYCVSVDPSIDMGSAVAHATPRGGSYDSPRSVTVIVGCGPTEQGIQVNVFNATGEREDGDFYLSVP